MSTSGLIMAATMLLSGSEWGFSSGGEVYVQFNDGRVSGSGGCNRFAGGYEQAEDRLKISQLAVTQMACIDDAVMQKEREFLDILNAARRIEATHMKLVLKDEAGNELAVLVRRDWD